MVKKDRGFQITAHMIMICMTVMVIFPVALLIMSSLSPESDIIKYGYSLIPKKIDVTAYRYIFGEGSVFHSYLVTIFVTLAGTAVSVVITTMISYTLTVPGLPGKRILSFYVLFTMLFSGGLVPSYMMWCNMFQDRKSVV